MPLPPGGPVSGGGSPAGGCLSVMGGAGAIGIGGPGTFPGGFTLTPVDPLPPTHNLSQVK